MIAARWQDWIGEGLFTNWAGLMVSGGLQIPGITIRNKQRLGQGTYLAQISTSLLGHVPFTIHRDGQTPIRTYDRSIVLTSQVSRVPDPSGSDTMRSIRAVQQQSQEEEVGARAVIDDQPVPWTPNEFLPFAEIQFKRVEGASRYRVKLSTGGAAGTTLALIQDNNDAEYFVYRTFALMDETIYGILIEPEDVAGQGPEGGGLGVIIDPVVYPTAELITYTYDEEGMILTVNART